MVAPNDLDNFDNENFNQQHQPHRSNNYNNEQLTAAHTPNDLIDGSELKSELFFSQQLFYLSIVFLVAHACIQLIFQHESDKSSRQVHRSNRKSSCYCAQVSTFCIKQASHCWQTCFKKFSSSFRRSHIYWSHLQCIFSLRSHTTVLLSKYIPTFKGRQTQYFPNLSVGLASLNLPLCLLFSIMF